MIEAAAKIGRSDQGEHARAARGLVHRWVRAAVVSRLSRLRGGQLRLVEAGNEQILGQPADDGLSAEAHVLDSRCFRHLLFGGSLGAAESYILGHWTTPDLTNLIRLFCRNLDSSAADAGWARLGAWGARAWHLLHGNSRRGSRRNIAAHYDLGNEFFATFLDRTMAYSCAVFPRADADLAEASLTKFDRIAEKLDLRGGDDLLEIGTGWGGFALHAASRYGCRVVTTTISPAQHAYACRQVAQAGLGDLVEVLDRDYRDLEGQFDKLVSIEMIEAVGRRYLDTFFATCSRRLKPDGQMLLQAIVMPDQRYRQYCRGTDFIQRYVFPGGHLPSLGAICDSVGRATDMQIVSLEDITPHYAETLLHWRRNFREQIDAVRAQGFDEQFLRLWDYYLCYCEAGFRERVIGCVQILLAKPRRRLALTRTNRDRPRAEFSTTALCKLAKMAEAAISPRFPHRGAFRSRQFLATWRCSVRTAARPDRPPGKIHSAPYRGTAPRRRAALHVDGPPGRFAATFPQAGRDGAHSSAANEVHWQRRRPRSSTAGHSARLLIFAEADTAARESAADSCHRESRGLAAC